MSIRDTLVYAGAGATLPIVNSYVAPYTDGILGGLGVYTNEARTAIIGALAYKFGGGIIRDAGRAYYQYAAMSAGMDAAAQFIGTSGSTGNASSQWTAANGQSAFAW